MPLTKFPPFTKVCRILLVQSLHNISPGFSDGKPDAHLTASFPAQPAQAGIRNVKLVLILMKPEMMGWQWHQLDHTQIICTSLQPDNHASTSPLVNNNNNNNNNRFMALCP